MHIFHSVCYHKSTKKLWRSKYSAIEQEQLFIKPLSGTVLVSWSSTKLYQQKGFWENKYSPQFMPFYAIYFIFMNCRIFSMNHSCGNYNEGYSNKILHSKITSLHCTTLQILKQDWIHFFNLSLLHSFTSSCIPSFII